MRIKGNQSGDYQLIQLQILRTKIIGIVLQSVRRITNDILGVKGLILSKIVHHVNIDSFAGSWMHLLLLWKVRKLCWLRDRPIMWMVWQFAVLPWRSCWRTSEDRMSRLVLLLLLYGGRRGMFTGYNGKWKRGGKEENTYSIWLLNIFFNNYVMRVEWYFACTNQIAALGYASHTNQIAA